MAKGMKASHYPISETGAEFATKDARLQELYDKCVRLCRRNEADFGDKRVLREGSDYDGVWLETQPMGGEMYARYNMEVALNNQLIFMENQRKSGRFPGMIKFAEPFLLQISYDWLQGYCFPIPALKMAYHIGLDKAYLELLYESLEAYDAYLWAYRDSDGDGCLETWCTWDTGEDNSARFLDYGVKDGGWGGEEAPRGHGKLPYESMDVMAYSYCGRDVLARVSSLLGNGKSEHWREQAERVRRKLRDYLWDDERCACFDRDSDNLPIPILTHNNLRCMYYGVFTREMADAFVTRHLMNEAEFWTPLPLPSIAVSEPHYNGGRFNNWGGPCQGLTYQRAVQALENYGYLAEIRLLGNKWLDNLTRTGRLVQQYDPFTGRPGLTMAEGGATEEALERFTNVGNIEPDGYGPTILAALEYLSLRQGVNYSMGVLRWSAMSGLADSVYTQRLHGRHYTLGQGNGRMVAKIDGKAIFECHGDAQVDTTPEGELLSVAGIGQAAGQITLAAGGSSREFTLAPNEIRNLR